MLASHSQYLEKLSGRMKLHCVLVFNQHFAPHAYAHSGDGNQCCTWYLGFRRFGFGSAGRMLSIQLSSELPGKAGHCTKKGDQANQTTPRCGASPLNFSILSLWVCHQSRPAVLWELWPQFLLLRLSWVLCGTRNPPKPSRWKPLLSCRSPGGRT